jgi:hypothetical protein
MTQSAEWALVQVTIALVIVTFLVAITALLVPMVSVLLKRKAFAPKLQVRYEHDTPYCVRTELRSQVNPSIPSEPVYYVRFIVENTGKSRAENCEVVLQELYLCDASGKPRRLPNFSSMNLSWSLVGETFVQINPRREILCDIGHVASQSYQEREERRLCVDIPGYRGDDLRFQLQQVYYPFSQPNCLAPGKYLLKIVVYSENAPTVSQYFEVAWSGKWQEAEQDMLRELVVERVNRT